MASLNQIVIQAIIAMDIHRRGIITEKVKLLRTLYRPLPPPFLLSKAKAFCSSLPPQKKVSKNCTLIRALVATACLIWILHTR